MQKRTTFDTLKLLITFMRGSRLLYILAILWIGCATFFSYASPLVLRTTIDSIIGNKPINAPLWVMNIITFIGGRSHLAANLWMCSLLIFLLTIANGFFSFLSGRSAAVATETTTRNIRDRLYDHLQHLPYDYHVKAETGDLVQRCTSDVETVRVFLAVQSVEVGRAIFMASIALPIMFKLDATLTLVSLPVILIVFAFSFIFFTRIQKAFTLSDESEARLSTILQENLTGVRVVRAFARQQYEVRKFDRENGNFRRLTYRLIRLMAAYWTVVNLISLLQIGAILITGTYWSIQGKLTIGTLVVFLTYEGMLLWPIRQMGRILADMGKALVSLGRIKEILDEPAEAFEPGLLKPVIAGNIEYRNVSFSYGEERAILKNISFIVKKGMTVAILGPTGSGKTSLMHLLSRLYEYTSGSILIDGVELKEIDRKWIRKHIGFVLQEPFLYAKTIKENIGLPKKDAKEVEIFEAARMASLHTVIKSFQRGYDTPVGERGITLSGGQKQRVAIARALMSNSPILVFDDSLSAVDTETDAAIRKALQSKSAHATTFIISHRLNTLANADLILVIENGCLVQTGTHEELLARDGLYRRIWAIQNTLEDELNREMDEEQNQRDLA
ncbi:MAG: ABC transporter ATP-binding protein [Spirochaetota bacterium]